MKHVARVGFVLGLIMAAFIVAREGLAPIGHLLLQAGWLLLLLVPLHLLPLWLDAVGWRGQILHRASIWALLQIATIREAINRLLPVASVGGEIAGAHLLTRLGVPAAVAAASVIVELVLTLAAQTAFIALGVMSLVESRGDFRQLTAWLLTLGAIIPVPLLSFWLLRSGALYKGVRALATRFVRDNDRLTAFTDGWRSLEELIRRLTGDGVRLLTTLAWQWVALVVGCMETWFAMRWLGHPVTAAAAVALDSLTLAVRSVAFVIPAGLGVQEAGMIGIGALLGIGSDVAVTLSLVKRLREVLFGVGAFALWQWTESHARVVTNPRLCER